MTTKIDKLVIFVHPTWSGKDLGSDYIDEWKANLDYFAADESYGLIITGLDNNKPNSQKWDYRVRFFLDTLPNQFKDRYIAWHENYIEQTKQEHIDLIARKFNRDPNLPFNEILVDGLYQGLCVNTQKRKINEIADVVLDWPIEL